VHGLFGSLAWASDHARVAGPSLKTNSSKIISKKNVIFHKFFTFFYQYWFEFLYCKDTNPVLKYLIFVKTYKKKYFVFKHMTKSLKNKKKNHIVFSYNKENFKNMY
jgi:hypothetical protein